MDRRVLLTACLWLAVLSGFAFFAWIAATSEARILSARAEGAAEAQAEIDAAGGFHAWAARAVNGWCAAHGREPAYNAEER